MSAISALAAPTKALSINDAGARSATAVVLDDNSPLFVGYADVNLFFQVARLIQI